MGPWEDRSERWLAMRRRQMIQERRALLSVVPKQDGQKRAAPHCPCAAMRQQWRSREQSRVPGGAAGTRDRGRCRRRGAAGVLVRSSSVEQAAASA